MLDDIYVYLYAYRLFKWFLLWVPRYFLYLENRVEKKKIRNEI